MSKLADKPYDKYYLYGPIYHKRIDRYMVCLVFIHDNKIRTSMTYARYLVSVKEGRRLKWNEEADHINNDHKDDRIENLQVLPKFVNNSKDRVRTHTDLVCSNCQKKFKRLSAQVKIKNLNYFCTRECGWNFQRK